MNSLQKSIKTNAKSSPHSVLVIALRELDALEIDYPALYHKSPDPVANMANVSKYETLIHIPMPSVTNVPTPASLDGPSPARDH